MELKRKKDNRFCTCQKSVSETMDLDFNNSQAEILFCYTYTHALVYLLSVCLCVYYEFRS